MKIKLLLFVLFLGCNFFHVKAQVIETQVNENVELMAIISRLAGFSEYHMDLAGEYITDMDEYFKEQTIHPIVQYMQKLREEYGISFDAVMSMAINLINNNGTFSLIEDTMGGKWAKVDKTEFLSLLSRFYKDSKFNKFFIDHQNFYEKGLNFYRENVTKHFDVSWYENFYGKEPQETFSIIIGFCNGGGNYEVNRQITGQKREIFAVVGFIADQEKLSMYSKKLLPTLVHEFNHFFINPLLDEIQYPDHVSKLESAAQYLYTSSKWAMSKQAYGNWKSMINESLVRAAVICYMLDENYPQEEIKNELVSQIQRNYRWMPELVCLLRKYEKEQSQYKCLENFYPHIIDFFSDYAQQERDKIEASLK